MLLEQVFTSTGTVVADRRMLLAAGIGPRVLTAAVRDGYLIRVRRDRYCLPGAHLQTIEAVRVGGRLACVSALAQHGVFVYQNDQPHIHMSRASSRLRAPNDRHVALPAPSDRLAALHWSPLIDADWREAHRVSSVDALAQALRCQTPRMAIATIDSALHLGLVDDEQLRTVFSALPARFLALAGLLDARAESGPESLLRLIVRQAGLSYELQVPIRGVGRVDMVVEGCLVVEADSRTYHDGWDAHSRDRSRDMALAAAGYMSLRALYRDIVFEPNRVRDGILGLLRRNRLVMP